MLSFGFLMIIFFNRLLFCFTIFSASCNFSLSKRCCSFLQIVLKSLQNGAQVEKNSRTGPLFGGGKVEVEGGGYGGSLSAINLHKRQRISYGGCRIYPKNSAMLFPTPPVSNFLEKVLLNFRQTNKLPAGRN